MGGKKEAEYSDNGCSVSPSCFSCPLPVCRYDVGGPAALRAYRESLRPPTPAIIAVVMPKRSKNGAGSVYQRKDGLYGGAVSLPTGRRFVYAKTRPEVEHKMALERQDPGLGRAGSATGGPSGSQQASKAVGAAAGGIRRSRESERSQM